MVEQEPGYRNQTLTGKRSFLTKQVVLVVLFYCFLVCSFLLFLKLGLRTCGNGDTFCIHRTALSTTVNDSFT